MLQLLIVLYDVRINILNIVSVIRHCLRIFLIFYFLTLIFTSCFLVYAFFILVFISSFLSCCLFCFWFYYLHLAYYWPQQCLCSKIKATFSGKTIIVRIISTSVLTIEPHMIRIFTIYKVAIPVQSMVINISFLHSGVSFCLLFLSSIFSSIIYI